jgi:hypothetical protein
MKESPSARRGEEVEGSPCEGNGGSTGGKSIPIARSCTSEGPSAHGG